MSLDNIFNLGSVFAVIVSAAAIILTTRKRARQPVNNNLPTAREQRLEQRVADLERQAEQDRQERQRLENTVNTLQSLLYEKQAEINQLMARIWQLEHPESVPAAGGPARPAHPQTLLAVVGEDPALKIDLAALREVERESSLRVSRVYPVTKARLKATLDRFRVNGRPVEYVHMAVHAGPMGLAFQGEAVDAAWLSENLKSVKVLLINGCESDQVGDWIGVVPTVVTMRESITHEDAAQFAKLFWSAVARGVAPEDAYYQARERSPQNVAEFVELN